MNGLTSFEARVRVTPLLRTPAITAARIANVLISGTATAVLVIWWAIDAFPRHRGIPSRDCDKGSLLALNLGHGFQVAGVVIGFLGAGHMAGATAPIQLCGLGLMFAGIAVRWTAMHALGRFFTGRVKIHAGHRLLRTGIYSRLRHPAYAGSLLAYIGLGLALSNWWTLACCVLPYVVALSYRIRVEESVLHETFGPAYAQYARTTKRLVPWVY